MTPEREPQRGRVRIGHALASHVLETVGPPDKESALSTASLRTVPSFVQHIKPPIVSYSYTNIIRNIIFNHKAVIKDIDFGMGHLI